MPSIPDKPIAFMEPLSGSTPDEPIAMGIWYVMAERAKLKPPSVPNPFGVVGVDGGSVCNIGACTVIDLLAPAIPSDIEGGAA